jgi:uncharacterized protein (DUF362 family)
MRQEDFLKLERKVEEVNDWRHRPTNVYTRDGHVLVSKATTNGRNLDATIKAAVDAIGGVRRALHPQDRVLLKANFNSDDEYPASTDLGFLVAVVEVLRSEGITNLTLGERSGWPWMPTKKVLKVMGVLDVAKTLDLPVIGWKSGWVIKPRPGKQ